MCLLKAMLVLFFLIRSRLGPFSFGSIPLYTTNHKKCENFDICIFSTDN